jgi:hypothetical protein
MDGHCHQCVDYDCPFVLITDGMKNKIISTLTSFQSGSKDILVVLGRAIPALVAELVLALLDTLRKFKQQQQKNFKFNF